MSASKLERLLNLTAALLSARRPLRAEEIRRRVPGYPDELRAFRRAFERDKDDLREMGIPLRLEPIAGEAANVEGYLIRPEEYYLNDPGLTPEELAALHLAAAAVRMDGVSGQEALRQLGPAFEPPSVEAPLAALRADPALPALFSGLLERRPVTFTYNGKLRTLDPYRLDHQRGRWYVSGFDHERAEPRTFRVDRIEGAVRAGRHDQRFERAAGHAAPGVPAPPWQLGEGTPITARLLVDADQAAWAAHHVGEEAVVERRADGAVVIELAVTNRDAFRSFVLGFLDHAEILSPPELRAELRDWLAAVIAAGASA
ncbi:MAG: helix-turn-helix transcriptional regulator [Acidimicrobiales bacterium]